MPNHVTNEIEIIGTTEQIVELKNFMKSGDNPFNFENIVQLPNELKDTRSPMQIISQEEYDKQENEIAVINEKVKNKTKLTDAEQKKVDWGLSRCLTAELSKKCIEKYGTDNWYDFQIKEFGTKWNCYTHYGFEEEENGNFGFQTAWSHPYPIMEKLSIMFPDVSIDVRYADEDFGYNVGEYTIKNGELLKHNIPEGGSDEAYEIALQVQGSEDYYLYDIFVEEDHDIAEIKEDNYYMFFLRKAVESDYLDAEIPIDILKLGLEYAIEKELYANARHIQNAIDCVVV